MLFRLIWLSNHKYGLYPAIKMAGISPVTILKLCSSNAYHILAIGGWHHLWLKCQEYSQLKEIMSYRFKREKSARVHFIPDLKVGVFVTLRAPEVIKQLR